MQSEEGLHVGQASEAAAVSHHDGKRNEYY